MKSLYFAIIVASSTLIAQTSKSPARQFISADSAMAIARLELATLGLTLDSMNIGTMHKALTTDEFNQVTLGGEQHTIQRAEKWLKGKTFWRCQASFPRYIDAITHVYVDAVTGTVLCAIPFDQPLPPTWEKRYDDLQHGK
jgi:hypothetical protein